MEDKKPKQSTWMTTEMNWLAENRAFLEAHYPGKYIAVSGAALVGVGDTMVEGRDQALEKGSRDPLLSGVRDKEYQGIHLIRHASKN